MSELAHNLNGESFEVPPAAVAWRVRKLKAKGAPEVVYGREGIPLILPIDADMDDLRREARQEGKYRVDALDEHSRPIAGQPAIGRLCSSSASTRYLPSCRASRRKSSMSASMGRISGMPSRPYTTSGAPFALSLRTRHATAAGGTSNDSPFRLCASSDIVFRDLLYIYGPKNGLSLPSSNRFLELSYICLISLISK